MSNLIRALFVSMTLGLPAVCLPAWAGAAPVYPGASGVGLEPPPGMKPAKTFSGFKAGAASIVITEMPKAAYAQIEANRDMFVKRLDAKNAETLDVNGVRGFVIKGTQVAGPAHFRKWILVLDGQTETALVSAQVPDDDTAISESAVDAALRTVAFRPRPGLDAQVAALPFAIGDLAGFRISSTALGAALILADGPKDVDPNQSQAHIVVTATDGAPAGDHAAFAKSQLASFQAVHATEVQSAKVFDAGGAQWAQVDAQGTEGQAGTPVSISYFIRFGATDFLNIVCIAPQAKAQTYADRFKSLALSVKPQG